MTVYHILVEIANLIPPPNSEEILTHDATQNADYSGGDTNETMQSNK